MDQHGGYQAIPEMAEIYDSIPGYNNRRDVDFYLNLCREANGEILDLGCGTGRILIPAAKAGCRITGLEYSTIMLEGCRRKLAALAGHTATLVHGDMTNFRLDREFSLAIIPFRPFQHLVAVEEQLSCLTCVHRHLAPGGKLVFDVFNPDPLRLTGPADTQETEDTSECLLPDGRSFRRSFRITARHLTRQINEVEFTYYLRDTKGMERRLIQSFPFRYFFRFEIEHLLARAGFHIAALYGNFDRSPLVNGSAEMIFVAEQS